MTRGLGSRLTTWCRQCWQRFFPPQTLGQRGEVVAARYLKQRGYRIVARELRLRLGEIDLVATQDRTVVFVEVKTRRSLAGGHPAEAVSAVKQRRISRTALAFLKKHGLLEQACRFDVIAITWPAPASPPQIEHFVGAFEAVGPDSMYG